MDVIKVHDHEANQYDQQARAWGWNPEVFFGLMWEYVKPGERLLDAGIGTGLCSKPFFKAGVEITGFDGSEKMLHLCRDNLICDDLMVHRIEDVPWPYLDARFEYVITGGVLHFFGGLGAIFKQARRLLTASGVFAFNLSLLTKEDQDRHGGAADTSYAKVPDEASGVSIYKHGETYIVSLLGELGMTVEKQLTFMASRNPKTLEEHHSTLFVARTTAG